MNTVEEQIQHVVEQINENLQTRAYGTNVPVVDVVCARKKGFKAYTTLVEQRTNRTVEKDILLEQTTAKDLLTALNGYYLGLTCTF